MKAPAAETQKANAARTADACSPLAPVIGKGRVLVIHWVEIGAILWATIGAARQSPIRESNSCWSAGGLETGMRRGLKNE